MAVTSTAIITDVDDIKSNHYWERSIIYWFFIVIFSVSFSLSLNAAVLSEDRADIMYHSYDGGGVQVNGPAVLVRKGFADQVSVAASYYVDSITSASIDVVTQASKYTDKRTEIGASIDYLHQDTLMNISYTVSEESDYDANTFDIGVSQEVFGGMTTIDMGFTRGKDIVRRNNESTFEENVDRWQYRLGVSQVITKSILLGLNYESISDQGFLNNPYRFIRWDVPLGSNPFIHRERYPRTRSSHATSLRILKYFQNRSSARFEYRFFQDTWDIKAHTYELGYSQYLGDRWLLDVFYRNYKQNSASFYNDLFIEEQNYMARDKELSTFQNQSLGIKTSYDFMNDSWGFLEKGSLNLSYEFVDFDYSDFTDVRNGKPYSFTSSVSQLFLSLWY